MAQVNLIELRKVVKVYKTPAGEFTALKGVDLEVEAGEFVAVIGKSGSGKSTLINTVTGIDHPTGGEVIVAGTPIHRLNEAQMAKWRGRSLGVIFQFFQLLPTLSLVENVMLPMEFARLHTPRVRRERAMQLLELVGMAEQAVKMPAAVSGGQQQRVAIARALANDPPIIVADEPTGSLDSKTALAIYRIFEDLVAHGKTILMVTHDRDLASRVTRVVLISDGEIVDQYAVQAMAGLDRKELAQVLSKAHVHKVQPGEVIVKQGEPSDAFYIIAKGSADVSVTYPDGSELEVDHLTAGQYFGEIGILRGVPRTATVRAAPATEVSVIGIDRDTFVRLMERSHLTREQFTSVMSERLLNMERNKPA